MNVRAIYQELLNRHGHQNWWPISETKNASWHDKTFEIIIGTILTQNTNWNNVETALQNLCARRCLNVEAMIAIDDELLKNLIRPTGYYNQKAKKLKLIARYIQDYFNGNAQIMAQTIERNDLLQIWGIGNETADSILLYAGDRPEFVIDTYTKRLCAHHGVILKTYDCYKQFFENQLDRNTALFNEYHALIVAWGKFKRPL